MTKHPFVPGCLAVALAVGLSLPAAAQLPATPRALGVGGAYLGMARGQEALFVNPANLALPGNPSWSFSLPQLGMSAMTLGPSFEDFARFAIGEEDDRAANRLLGAVPPSGMELDLDLRVPAFALQVGPAAVGVSYGAAVQQTIGKDLVELLLNGYEEGREDYQVGNTTGSYATYLDFAAGYGRRVGPVSLGLSGHYLRGLTLSRSRLLEPRYGDEREPIEIDYLEVLASGGNGFALDVGAAWQPVPRLTVGAAVSNLLGTMSWSDELRVRDVTLGDEDLEPGLIELRERFQTSERPLPADGSEPAASALAAGIYDRANLPASLRLGAGFAPWPGARLGASYDHALTAGELSRGWDRSLGLGVQQKLAFLGLRAGYATSLDGRSMLTGGASLGPLDVGIAKIDGTSGGYERSGWVVALGAGIRGRIGQ